MIVTIAGIGDRRFKSWQRDLTGVDGTQKGGFMFQFTQWFNGGRKVELAAGTLILFYGEAGSWKNREQVAKIKKLQEDGTFKTLAEARGQDWALDLRDAAADIIQTERERRVHTTEV